MRKKVNVAAMSCSSSVLSVGKKGSCPPNRCLAVCAGPLEEEKDEDVAASEVGLWSLYVALATNLLLRKESQFRDAKRRVPAQIRTTAFIYDIDKVPNDLASSRPRRTTSDGIRTDEEDLRDCENSLVMNIIFELS